MEKVSAYILTHNSEKYLSAILDKMGKVADEILIIDSGSTDSTKRIASRYDKVRIHFRKFTNFKEQRIFAEDSCSYNILFFLDSDELPDDVLIADIQKLKAGGFHHQAYSVSRKWNVLGKDIHSIYPIISPDYPIRIYNKNHSSFRNSSQLVHEAPLGHENKRKLNGNIQHITFETKGELEKKLEFYTDIAALDLIRKGKKISAIKLIVNPLAAFVKWYVFKDGFKDGRVGLVLGRYAYLYTRKKYEKARHNNSRSE